MKQKKILFEFTRELEDELKMYGLDVEQELISILSTEISKKIDNEKTNEIISLATERNVCQRKVLFEKFTPIVIGIKSKTFLEPGYIYAPYVPVIQQTIIEEADFIPLKIESRYATKK